MRYEKTRHESPCARVNQVSGKELANSAAERASARQSQESNTNASPKIPPPVSSAIVRVSLIPCCRPMILALWGPQRTSSSSNRRPPGAVTHSETENCRLIHQRHSLAPPELDREAQHRRGWNGLTPLRGSFAPVARENGDTRCSNSLALRGPSTAQPMRDGVCEGFSAAADRSDPQDHDDALIVAEGFSIRTCVQSPLRSNATPCATSPSSSRSCFA